MKMIRKYTVCDRCKFEKENSDLHSVKLPMTYKSHQSEKVIEFPIDLCDSCYDYLQKVISSKIIFATDDNGNFGFKRP